MDNVEQVKSFLRAQNLEQVGRTPEAIDLYEAIVAEGFDSTGPYDRLITIYAGQARHHDVIRVATSALEHIRSHSTKRGWYEQMRSDAEKASSRVPQAVPRSRR